MCNKSLEVIVLNNKAVLQLIFNKKNKNKIIMSKYSQSDLEQGYVQRTKSHLCLSTVQNTTKVHVFSYNPLYFICTINMYSIHFTWALVHKLCYNYSVQIATCDKSSCFTDVNPTHQHNCTDSYSSGNWCMIYRNRSAL